MALRSSPWSAPFFLLRLLCVSRCAGKVLGNKHITKPNIKFFSNRNNNDNLHITVPLSTVLYMDTHRTFDGYDAELTVVAPKVHGTIQLLYRQ